jgi:hypothetical protein
VQRGSDAGRRLVILYVSGLFIVGVSFLATTVVFIDSVAMLFVPRLAPLVLLLAYVMISTTLLEGITNNFNAWFERRSLWHGMLAAAGLMTIIGTKLIWMRSIELLFYVMVLAVIGIGFALPHITGARSAALRPRIMTALLAVVFVATVAGVGLPQFRESTLLFGDSATADRELFAWAARTPKNTLFVVPPGFSSFRVRTGRSIVVDWKSVPGLPAEILAWYGRLADLTGLQNVTSDEAADAAYAQMDAARMTMIAAKYHPDYMVFQGPVTPSLAARCKPAFRDRDVIVCSVPALLNSALESSAMRQLPWRVIQSRATGYYD